MRWSERAVERLAELGILKATGNVMLQGAAPLTHPIGNLRYDRVWFLVQNDTVELCGQLDGEWKKRRMIFQDAIACRECLGTMYQVIVDPVTGKETIELCPRMRNRQLPLCQL